MFGRVIDIIDNYVIVENTGANLKSNILNYHVIFEELNRSVVGEVVSISKDVIKIFLVGEIIGGKFFPGIMKKPSFNDVPRIIYKGELELLLGKQDLSDKNYFYLGKSVIYDNFFINVNLNDFFSNHFAIIGNTGSGKSCGVARVIQNVFRDNKSGIPNNAHVVIFDVYGEYNSSFNDFNNVPNLGYKNISSLVGSGSEIINIPAYFLDIDDLALLLGATSSSQLPILEKALKFVYIFSSRDNNTLKYKNDIIASALMEILTSGRSSSQIRDQIIAILSRYNSAELNVDTPIYEPGYSRTIRQCLNIDNNGKMAAVDNVISYLSQFEKIDLSTIVVSDNVKYTLDDLYSALDFALISEGAFKSEKVYDEYNQLKVRLLQIINSDNKHFFDVSEKRISKKEYVENLFASDKKYQIINYSLNYLEERFAKNITKILTRLFFNYTNSLENRASFPINIILEEAHRYVQNDNDINVIGYNIFDRITKEGRKYGLLLGFITQRPSELSNTSLSQCSNFISFKMFHPDDLEIISNISSNVSKETVEKIKNLSPGSAMIFGVSFKIPLIAKLDLPNPMPQSTSVDIVNNWYS